jgi:hypothetical protein
MIAPGTEVRIHMTNRPPDGIVITCDLDDSAEASGALADVLRRLSELSHDLRDLVRDIEIGPLILSNDGGGACVVDCTIVPG